MTIQPVPLAKFYRLMNHGPVTLVSAKHGGVENVMSVAWACALDFDKVSIVVASTAYTRGLIEKSGRFAVQIPTARQADLILDMGESRHDHPDKMNNVGIFYQQGFDIPLVKDCAAWIACELIAEPHNQNTYDLLIGKVRGAWADDRVFRNGRWLFDEAPEELRTLHYVAGGQFYAIGKGIKFDRGPDME